jgi:hypothetical protein
MANDKIEVMPPTPKNLEFRPVELDIPKTATASGELRLTFTKPAGLGGNGRGVQISEMWLIRQ